jgi:predicted dehydrogenase
MSNSSSINWGILATGRIARKFAEGLRLAPGARLLAVASRRKESAESFSREYNVPRAYDHYAALAHDPDVQVIYVASPHSGHHDHTLMALRAGKAVLCEKPMAINAAQVAEMIAAARSRKLFLMEAMWTRFFPAMMKVREWVDSGVLGELGLLTADFSFCANRSERSRLFDPALGGGALLDVGIYPVALASWLMGLPKNIVSQAHLHGGVDEMCAMTFNYGDGRFAQLTAGIVLDTAQEAVLCGRQGRVRIRRPWWHPHALTLSRSGKPDESFEFPRDENGYQYEAIEVMRCLREGRLESDRMPLNESLAIAQTMDTLRAQWGLRYPMEDSTG